MALLQQKNVPLLWRGNIVDLLHIPDIPQLALYWRSFALFFLVCFLVFFFVSPREVPFTVSRPRIRRYGDGQRKERRGSAGGEGKPAESVADKKTNSFFSASTRGLHVTRQAACTPDMLRIILVSVLLLLLLPLAYPVDAAIQQSSTAATTYAFSLCDASGCNVTGGSPPRCARSAVATLNTSSCNDVGGQIIPNSGQPINFSSFGVFKSLSSPAFWGLSFFTDADCQSSVATFSCRPNACCPTIPTIVQIGFWPLIGGFVVLPVN
jgi:hypothetical protein